MSDPEIARDASGLASSSTNTRPTRPARSKSYIASLNLGSDVRQSFENLVSLANDAETLRSLRNAKKIVWRERGEPAVELKCLLECLRHAKDGGMRAALLGFGIRAGVNVFLLLFRVLRVPKSFRFALIRHAVFGPDSFRFGALFGTFVALYKFLLNYLPILTGVACSTRRKESDADIEAELDQIISPKYANGELDMSKEEELFLRPKGHLTASAKEHEIWVRKRGLRWHAALAGAIAGGLGVMWEKPERRLVIAQQMFVRGLQGSYNSFSSRHGIRIPYGAVLVFSLSCGQILYGWLLRPDTLDRSYRAWVQQASGVLPKTVNVNRDLVREHRFKPEDMQWLIDWKRTTPKNKAALLSEMEKASHGDFGYPFSSCAATHPWLDTCWAVPHDRFITSAKMMFPIYGALHFIPPLLFKPKQFAREPGKMLARVLLGTGRSVSFLGTLIVIFQSLFCFKNNLYKILSKRKVLPERLLAAMLISKPSFWAAGFLCGLSLFVEAERRRADLAMYVLPKGLESAWAAARGRGWVWGGKGGDAILCAIGMGMVMSTYQNDPQHLSGLVRRVLYQFIGPN